MLLAPPSLRHTQRGPARPGLVALGFLLAGCGGSDPSARPDARIELARGFRPTVVATAATEGTEWARPVDADEPLTISRDPVGSGFWIRTPVRREDWRGSPVHGTLRFRYPIAPSGTPPGGGDAFRLVADGRTYEAVPFAPNAARWLDPEPGWITVAKRNLFLVLGEDDLPPELAYFDAYVGRGAERDGIWRLTVGSYTAPGIPVWSGHEESVTLDVPPSSSLRVATTAFASLPDLATGAASLRFRIDLDDVPLFEHDQAFNDYTQAEAHVIVLPPGGARNARLTFRVDGPAAVAGFLSPVIGPAAVAPLGSAERAAADPRPNVILFLADTFRADNLAFYGGPPGLTPELDRFADACLRFERAWSVSAWTLPAQSTMVSGLHPHQHGVTESTRRIADEVVTIAERLGEAGYRTGAVTGGGYLSPAFGFDQGFSWFDQSWIRWDVEDSTRDVEDFLDTDDGRPLFLFVQTYRAHGPYVVRDETIERFADVLGLDRDWRELSEGIAAASEGWSHGEPFSPALTHAVTAMRDLYLGAVHDLDRGFGVFLDMLERRGLGESFLLFTSDHGEAFGEHDNLMHGGGVWDEMTRVPLLIRGPGVTPKTVSYSATLVDIARTLADMAGVAPAPSWQGTSLLRLTSDRPAFLFDCSLGRHDYKAAIVDGTRKLTFADEDEAVEAGRLEGIFDLGHDPDERENRLTPSTWTAADADWLRHVLGPVRRPMVATEAAVLDPGAEEAMDALGYTGDD